jgi:tetratricopeptide (TPR) repeat protein
MNCSFMLLFSSIAIFNFNLYYLGTALAELQAYEKALEEFKAAEKILPDNQGIKSNIVRMNSLKEDCCTDPESD